MAMEGWSNNKLFWRLRLSVHDFVVNLWHHGTPKFCEILMFVSLQKDTKQSVVFQRSAGTRENVPRHIGETSRHIISETNWKLNGHSQAKKFMNPCKDYCDIKKLNCTRCSCHLVSFWQQTSKSCKTSKTPYCHVVNCSSHIASTVRLVSLGWSAIWLCFCH